jgi:3-dehydroquinate synthase
MDYLQQSFRVSFEYKVFFTEHVFSAANPVLREFLKSSRGDTDKKILVVIDHGVEMNHPSLLTQVQAYLSDLPGYTLITAMAVIPGGEKAKNNGSLFDNLIRDIDRGGVDRHSYIIAIGGGAVLDLVGYAAAVAHRGIRHIRIPTTVLSQNDSGVGVKNGINYEGKKNFLGTFAPPAAVFNDYHFLTTLSDGDWRSGISEAVKVALIKDVNFYAWLKKNAAGLKSRDKSAMQYLVKRCAELHVEHIASGDPFEMGSSRPLDFGHWSAHKTEQLSDFSIRHGEAVAMGIALDTAYSFLSGRLEEADAKDIVNLIIDLGLPVTNDLMKIENEKSPVLKGLNEFREHLGGLLTIMLLDKIGKGVEVHELDTRLLIRSYEWVRNFSQQ